MIGRRMCCPELWDSIAKRCNKDSMIATQGNKIAKHSRRTLEVFIFSYNFTQIEKLVQAVKNTVKSDIAHRTVSLTPF